MTDAAEAPRTSLRDRNRQQTRDAILRAAHLLTMRDGAAATSMVGVAELAGVSDTTVFNYFKTKADLLDAVVEETGDATRVLRMLATRPPDEGPFTALRHLMREQLAQGTPFDAAQTRSYLAAVRSDPALWASYLRMNHESGEILAAAFIEHAPSWTHTTARAAAHATVAALSALLAEIDDGWTAADLGDRVDTLLSELARAWP
jgi:AcrR family transcriptional regulator